MAADVNRTMYARLTLSIASKASSRTIFGGGEGRRMSRLADVLGTVSNISGAPLPLTMLLDQSAVRVRSKATIIMGGANRNIDWVQKRMLDPEARVSGNAVESIWEVNDEQAHHVFRQAVRGPNNRVIGSGLVGLYLLGDTASIPQILQMSCHAKATFRSTAAWVMGETADPRFIPGLGHMLRDSDEKVRSCAFKALQQTRQTVSRATSSAALKVALCNPGPAEIPDGRQVWAVATKPDGETPHIRPTQLALSANGRPVSDCRMEPRPLAGQLEIARPAPSRREAAKRSAGQAV